MNKLIKYKNKIMKNKKIIIAGGSGFIGQAMCNYFGEDNKIVILGRQTNETSGNAFGANNVNKKLLFCLYHKYL